MNTKFTVHACVAILIVAAGSVAHCAIAAPAGAKDLGSGMSASWDVGSPRSQSVTEAPAAASSLTNGGGELGVSKTPTTPGTPDAHLAMSTGPAWKSYYGTLDAINSESQLMKAQIENEKLRHDLEQARRGVFSDAAAGRGNAGVPPFPMAGQQSLTATAAVPLGEPPRALVQEVSMVDGTWTAKIRLSSGAQVKAHVGDTVRGVGKIKSIDLSQVSVEQNGKVTDLPFAGDGAQASAQSSPVPTPGGMPPGVR
ncbi:type IV pilus biogenesis protein PilP [Burkholderia stabilis]|uniref:type IV pilus biogenesis protein PilP n=1 Tax=Burkholderia stabilis TaxID=95485 RepID=UPI001F4AE17A|nr:type IV pilus biogenesis protein PilP [Burkholderia stabilis]